MSEGAGSPADALTALVSAAQKAIQHAPPEPVPDARVTAAFSLGWHVAELYRPERQTRVPARPDDLPALDRLEPEQRVAISLRQIDSGLARTAPAIVAAGLLVPRTHELDTAFAPPANDVARAQAVQMIHLKLLATLSAAEPRLGRAYGLGRALADTCRQQQTGPALAREFDPGRIAHLLSSLDDLASLLPAHAGKSVSQSLRRWSTAVTARPEAADLLEYLPRQGELWRALLAGEKAGADMLTIANYLDAAEGMIATTKSVAERFLRRFWWLTILIAVLFLGGIAAIIFAASSAASVVAGAAGVVASVGLTWKGVGNALGGPAGALEQRVWGAELDAAIADAITLLPDNDKEQGGRRKVAVQVRRATTGRPPRSPAGSAG